MLKFLIPKREVLMIGFRYLKSSKNHKLPSLITALCTLGISISVATLIVVISVMNGFRIVLTEKILNFSYHMSVYPFQSKNIEDFDDLKIKILTNESIAKQIRDIRPVNDGQGMIINKENNLSSGVIIKGFQEKDLQKLSETFEEIKGNITDLKHNYSIIICSEIANRLNIKVGDNVLLVSPDSSMTMFGIVPKHKTYKVSGIVKTGVYRYDEIAIFLPKSSSDLFLSIPHNATSMLEIDLFDKDKSIEIKHKLLKEIGNKYNIVTWQEENSDMIDALMIERNVMFFILFLFIIVAMFAIFANLIMMVNSKITSIAILRSMGLSSNKIGQIFFISGFSIASIGTIFGSIMGISFSNNIQNIRVFLENIFGLNLFNPAIYFLSTLPSKVITKDITKIIFMTIILSIIVSLLPAIKAAKKNPVKILKDL